jgi:nucleoside 2-deoxyribosyltransferase
MTKQIYLCGPITGLTYDEATLQRNELVLRFQDLGISALSPMRGKIFELQGRAEVFKSKGYTEIMATDKAIVGRDRNDVKSSDAILADLRGAKKASIGSMVEFGWADAYRIPIITVMEKDGNPHDHAFVQQLSTYVVSDMEEAIVLATILLNK